MSKEFIAFNQPSEIQANQHSSERWSCISFQQRTTRIVRLHFQADLVFFCLLWVMKLTSPSRLVYHDCDYLTQHLLRHANLLALTCLVIIMTQKAKNLQTKDQSQRKLWKLCWLYIGIKTPLQQKPFLNSIWYQFWHGSFLIWKCGRYTVKLCQNGKSRPF